MSIPAPPGRRSVLIGSAAAGALAATHGGLAVGETPAAGPWAIELFTSQGCSSCPPADARLGTLAQRPDIVALSYHVDYWDYIGWKDPFASHLTTVRQQGYARVLNQRYVYTPEMVVDGIGHDPGVDAGPIRTLLADAERRSPKRATPQMSRAPDGAVTVALSAFHVEGGPADVVLVVYDRRHSTPVHDGENGGRTLENFNVVRRFEVLDRWQGGETRWTIAADRVQSGQGLAVLVQRANQGPMLGCNKLEPNLAG